MAQDIYSGSITSPSYPQPTAAKIEPPVVGALRELGAASHDLAQAADAFIAARDTLNMARERHAICRDVVAKETESAGI